MTLNFKVNRQSHVICFGLFEIPDLENVEINNKIKSVACIQPEIRGHVGVCLTLIFKVKCQGHETNFSFFYILDLKNAIIDTEIEFVSRFLQ